MRMENHKHLTTNNRPYLVIIAILVLLLIAAGIWIAALLGTDGTPSGSASGASQTTEESGEVEKLTDTIAIPGFAQLNLKAGTCEQNVALSNPAQNFCYFKISLLLEDGTVIWVSELIEPGKQSEAITLLQSLDAILRIYLLTKGLKGCVLAQRNNEKMHTHNSQYEQQASLTRGHSQQQN